MSSKPERQIAIRGSLRLTLRFLLLLAAVAIAVMVVDWIFFQKMLTEGCHRMTTAGDPLTVPEVSSVARRTFWTHVPVVLAVVLLLGGSAAFLVTYQWTSRLRAVIRTVQDVTNTGDFHRRVQIDARQGAAPGAELFNAMLAMGDGMMSRMRESLDNVAHELRTPLTRMRAGAERALTQSADPNVCHGALSDALEESENLLQVVDTLLDIAEAETGVLRLHREAVPVAEVVQSVTDLYEYVAEDAGVRLEVDLQPDLTVDADPDRLRQVVANLLDNALKYGADGEVVRIEGDTSAGNVRIRVVDQGAGIPAEELPRIWKRLYRSGSSRRGAQKGLGLGLALVRAFVEAHDGTVSAESSPGRGATFTVTLPQAVRPEGS